MPRLNFDNKKWGATLLASGSSDSKCSNCGVEATVTIADTDSLGCYLGCKSCIDKGARRGGSTLGEGLGPDLHQKVGDKGRTVGKTWEIANRGMAEDGFSVINKKTGRLASL